MPNSIKYSTTGDTLSLKKGNLFFGVGDVPKGPSNITQHYNGVTPQSGSYMVYFYDPAQPNNIGFDPVSSDPALVEYTNRMFGTTFTSASECLTWYSTQPNRSCVNKDYESIVTNGLVLNLDAGFLPSYPTSGTTWYDMSYSGFNGTLTNGPTYSSLVGGYISFDGADDGLTLSSVLPNLSTFTVEIVFNPSAYQYMQFTLGSVDFKWRISGQTPYWNFWTTGGTPQSTTMGVIPPINTVSSFVASYDGNIRRVGLNGNYLNSISGVFTPRYPSSNIVGSTSFEEIYGSLYSIKIYNRALSSSEVLQNYNAGLSRFNTTNIVKSNLLFNLDSSNTVSYPTSGTTWTDLGGYGNTGTLINGPTFNSTSKSIVFDGANDYWQYSARTPNTEFQYYDAFTVESMAYVNENTSTGYLVTNRANKDGNNTSYAGWGLVQYNGYIYASIGGYPSSVLDSRVARISASTFNDFVYRRWSHITWVNTGVAGQQKIYINGVDRTSSAYDEATPPYVINYNGTQKLTVGMSPADGTPGGWFLDGNIDTVRVYNKALSQSEVLQNYYGGPIVTDGLLVALDAGNLVSYSGSSTNWGDLTTNNSNGTLINGPTFSTDGGGSIIFDGVDDYADISIPSVNSYNTITICGFIKWLSYGADMFLGMTTYDVWTQSNTLGFNNGASNVVGINAATVTSLGLLGNWKHYTFVMNKSGLLSTNKIYINGVSVGPLTAVVNLDGNIPGFNTNLRLCSWNNGSYNGNMQYGNLQVYNRELSPQEIGQNFNAQKSRFGL